MVGRGTNVGLALRRAVLMALALPACGTTIQAAIDAGTDGPDDASLDATADDAGDGGDAQLADDTSVEIPDVGPPDGCVIVGKPDSGAICYVEMLPDPVTCGVDLDADQQDPSVCSQLCRPLETNCYWYDLGDGGTMTCGFCNPGRLNDAARGEVGPRCYEPEPDAGAWLARAAHLEAASIGSFRTLAQELERHGAPRTLARAARRAARDEARHARSMAALARGRGAEPSRPRRRRSGLRPGLLALAIDNAVEGCVRETFSAALARWQSLASTDARVRAAMAPIARDEARHAALAWRVAAWVDAKLDEADRAAVRAARDRAVSELLRSVDATAPSEPLGLPDRARAAALLETLRADLWS